MKKPAIAIIGAGKVGSALGLLLQQKGYNVAGVASRTSASAAALAERLKCPVLTNRKAAAGAELIFITTPDREIAPVSKQIAGEGGFKSGQVVAHTSGAHAAGELTGVREAGALAVSIHPLQSFAEVQAAMENLPGSYFSIEGDEGAMPVARQVVEDLNGKFFTISAQDKPIYHAAACIASNYLVSLMHFATGLYAGFGLGPREAFEALYPLVRGTVANISKVGPTGALTGPVARGDGSTIEGHLEAFKNHNPELAELYARLGRYTVEVALEKGSINDGQANELEKIFKGAL
ncbi:Predicted oxidoreductase, contains short-chain dehydrogenase (SDR) and DUF2520 domains [Desulfotomaculum arcticum]|uniref:Predicted oxidoreductase, contains short-chain dehydrogenase (SDR) and DUF2520 domains n=1 Tax=Desulfotruncus arcticus DSM 17038 TaxID=1121424 RepID=A0A1I2XAE0_9FIRM|nr:Rossmann-like and DUF2520 domain-containing protein [Desulfotruncus arcticus]SFH09646.1 Predicted oxidoreductase, contains short-chain dehydrogenase (SDR) and DUF2520 domains [Desulfotomaculum arcticum] [Desulfotruncus arcticus DSM 17038]